MKWIIFIQSLLSSDKNAAQFNWPGQPLTGEASKDSSDKDDVRNFRQLIETTSSDLTVLSSWTQI